MVKHGIDVSKFQGLIDWQEVKKHIDFAIIRCGYGSNLESQDDPYFKRNADECTRLKIPFGDRKSTRLNSSHASKSRMPSSA